MTYNKRVEYSLKDCNVGHKTVPAMDSSRGGIEVVVEKLAPRLVEMGCEVICYNWTGCDKGIDKNEVDVLLDLHNMSAVRDKGLW